MTSPDRELRRLIDAWHDGTITPEDALRLESRLTAEGPAREYLFDIAEIEAALPAAAARLMDPVIPIVPRRASRWQFAAVFVAGLFLGMMVWRAFTPAPAAPLSTASVTGVQMPAATITGMLGVAWESHAAGMPMSFSAAAAETGVETGLVELTFASGTRAVIEGPASFRVLGSNALNLSRGRLVADVPKGAEGFTVEYPDGTIVDLGTEFGVEVMAGGRSANFGVFRGEIEYHPRHGSGRKVLLRENHAVTAEDGEVVSVPFQLEKFTRRLPSREFAWQLSDSSRGEVLEYDVSHLIWHPGRYRAICKWMTGARGFAIAGAELLLDGKLVARDRHAGFAGVVPRTQANSYDLVVPDHAYHRGHWTLRVHGGLDSKPVASPDSSSGVVLLEDGLALSAAESDFTGTWEYMHDGKVFRRTFAPGGTASLTIDGEPYIGFETATWTAAEGYLHLDVPTGGSSRTDELHFLRDARTLVFVNLPYRDARRVDD
ncbi:FecR family protein [Luteolibacter arcticus]|uniref:FecR family protein n=1 Tax=Luteolibacter arcticus TaxID=1581411 RepID=A0ABT3GLC4_9BACT|nr:FecR family protein [Luteolibacter arcticus]MCW1924323.1 FecR family protein [Luteolibacter arcticus]